MLEYGYWSSEQQPRPGVLVGLRESGSLFLSSEYEFSQDTAGLVIGIGNPDTTPPMLFMSNGVSYCPTGFSYWESDRLKNVGNFVQAPTFGRKSYSPLPKKGEIDPFISGEHLTIKRGENGQITVRNIGRNGTFVAKVPIITEMEGGTFNLSNGAMALGASRERRITLTVGQNNKVELIIGPNGVKKIGNKVVVLLEKNNLNLKGNHLLNKVLSRLIKNPQENNLKRLILGRNDINSNDEKISRLHLSIIWDPINNRYYLFDHSTNGTTVEIAETQNQPQKPPVREEREGETKVITPRLVFEKVGHPEQKIPDDPNSVGGDYYLFGSQVEKRSDLLEKGGDAVVVMDTASRQTGGETPATTTKPFAQKFLEEYYNQIDQGKDPKTAMEEAYRNTYNSNNVGGRTLGERTEATFTFVTVVGNTAYCLWIGNTEAVVVKEDGSVYKLASSEGMVYKSYYDKETRQWVSPTVLVASGEYQRTGLVELSSGDNIFIYTDGVRKLDTKNPGNSSLGGDDVVIVRL